MDKDSKFTRDEDGYVAVRTVSAPYSSGSDDKDSMFTRDEDGYVAVRVTGSGGGSGGDQHNLGYYATESALTTAHPTAEAGDWAIVGATDTVWIWDTDNSQWVDSDQKGQVTSVNNQTGAVTITGADILPTQTDNAGKFLVTNGTSASWDTSVKQLRIKASSTIYCDFFVVSPTGGGTGIYFNSGSGQNVQLGGNFVGGLSFISKLYVREIYYGSNNSQGIIVPAVGGTLALQIATLPTAGSTYEGTIYQFTGTTDSTYTNGHFYKCVSDGQTPATYSWEEISFGGGLPSQTGNAGKFLTTDGTDASWSSNVLAVKGAVFTRANFNDQALNSTESIWIGYRLGGSANTNHNFCCGIGLTTISATKALAVGSGVNISGIGGFGIGYAVTCTARGAMAIGHNTVNSGSNSVVINASGTDVVNTSPNVFKVANANGRFEIMSADGTIPTDRFTTTPSADGTYVPTLTISSGVATRSWSAPSGGGSTGTTASLVVANWSSNTQTVNVTGVTASNNVIVAPAPASQADYTAAGIICTAQGAGTLTFTCTTVPSSAITVNVLILG